MKLMHLFNANFRREFILLKRYLPNTISQLITFFCIFLAMFFGIKVIGDPTTMEANVQYTIVSYVFWFLSLMAMSGIGWSIMSEAQLGTLEQMYMSPMGAWRILLARIISTTVQQLVILVVLLYLSMLVTGTWLNIDVVSILPVLVFTIISMFGISFMIAGMAIIVKQINAFLQVLQFILMGLTFLPLSLSPLLALLPVVKGVDMVRHIMVGGISIQEFQWTDFSSLIANALIYLVLGILVFKRCERIAMTKGVLGQY